MTPGLREPGGGSDALKGNCPCVSVWSPGHAGKRRWNVPPPKPLPSIMMVCRRNNDGMSSVNSNWPLLPSDLCYQEGVSGLKLHLRPRNTPSRKRLKEELERRQGAGPVTGPSPPVRPRGCSYQPPAVVRRRGGSSFDSENAEEAKSS